MQSMPFAILILYNESNSVYCAYGVYAIGQEALAMASVYLSAYKIYLLINSTLCDYLKKTIAFAAYFFSFASLYAVLPKHRERWSVRREKWLVKGDKWKVPREAWIEQLSKIDNHAS